MRKSLHSADYTRFLAILTDARRKAGVTQQALADRLGRPQSFAAKYEKGERRIDIVKFFMIAQALDA
jgi:transcriptional regulator with XRE-family HTH domain